MSKDKAQTDKNAEASPKPGESSTATPPETDQAAAASPQEAADSESEAAPAESAERDKHLEELEQQVAQYKDLFLRKAADFENFKRRSENEASALVKFANEDLILSLLPVVDDMERALRAAKGDDSEAPLRKGIELILQKVMRVLDANGVKPMQTVGSPFDVNYHDVLLQMPRPDVPPHTVVEEVERGFLMHDKVLRHAKVIIAAPSEEGAAETPDTASAKPESPHSSEPNDTP